MNLNDDLSLYLRRLGAGAGILTGVLFAGYALTRPRLRHWGTTAEEIRKPLPGDALVPHPKLTTTRAVTISAPAEQVWPWLLQIGQDRGGFYSYDWLENLFGLDIHNADRIVPEWQELEVDDVVRLAPPPDPGLVVALVEPERALVLRSPHDNLGPAVELLADRAHPVEFSWAFVLEPLDEATTRLLVRERSCWAPGLGNTLAWRGFTEPASFVMERKMLHGIKRRAEHELQPA